MPPKKKEEDKKKDDEPKHTEVNFKSKEPQTLYHLLFAKEDHVLWRACDSLYNYTLVAEGNRAELFEMGVLQATIPHLSSPDAATRRSSVMLLNSLTQLEEARSAVRSREVVAALVNLLRPEETVMSHEHTTKCLLTIADQFQTKADILEEGGIESLVSLISNPDPLVLQNTLLVLELLSQDYECRIALNQANVVAPLLEAVKSEYPAIQGLVLKVLYLVCQEECVRVAMGEANGLEALLAFLKDEEMKDLHKDVINVVGVCMLDQDQLDAMKDSGSILAMASYLTTAEPIGQLNALRAIGACCQVGDNAKILHDTEIETTILSVLGSENSEVLAQACYTVSVLVNNPLCKETLAKIGVIQALMSLIGNEDEKVQEMSALSLANLSLSNRVVCLDILHDEHMPTMVDALENSQNPRVLTYLSHVIFNIVKFEPLREELVGYNVVQSLAASLTHRDADVCISVCKALAALVADESAREALLKTNGLGSLVTLLKEASNKEVLRKAAWTVGICVADEGMARELNKNGALRTLMDFVNNNTQGVSNLAVIALEKLLQYDLAAKYWHLGNLTQTDVIRDGFYDTGAHKHGEDFRSLKYLLDKSVDNKRPVLFISTLGADPELPADLKSEASTTGSTTNIKTGRTTAKGKKTHKLEEKKEDAPSEADTGTKEPKETGKPKFDSSFKEYVEEVTSTVGPLPTQLEQIKSLAMFVSNQMGGPVQSVSTFNHDLHIAQLKSDIKSNVIPIGFIKRGIFYHRALLFKALADRVGVPASLVRGEYNRAWNDVTLMEQGKAVHYLVNLMDNPGSLMEVGGYAAGVYKKL